MAKRVGIVGARGYVGSELIRLVAAHPHLELAFVSSREREGQRLREHEAGYGGELAYVAYGPAAAAALNGIRRLVAVNLVLAACAVAAVVSSR